MEIFESRNGEHWKETQQLRPLERMTRGDIFWFLLGHVLLMPLVLCVLLLTALCLPLYWVWGWWRTKHPLKIDIHGEVRKILANPRVDAAFVRGAEDDSSPAISVIMPIYNRVDWVDWAVGSVLRQELPLDTVERGVEIIVVDNGSTDGTLEKLGRHPVRIIHCPERGPGAARNAGIAAARAEIVAFTDSDCVADTCWLMNLTRRFFEDPDLHLAGGKIFPLAQDGFVATFTDEQHILDNERFFESGPFFPRFFATANAAARREALQKIGGFDNTLWMSEDADLCWRIMDLGGRMAFVDDAAIYHQHRYGLRGLFRQSINYGAASVSIFAKHRESLEAPAAVSWKNIRDIAWSPFNLVWEQFVAENNYHRQRELLYALWRLGFTYGSVRECIKRRVLFL